MVNSESQIVENVSETESLSKINVLGTQFERLKSAIGRTGLVLALSITTGVTADIIKADESSASADVTTYPWANAADYDVSTYEWWVDENDNRRSDVTDSDSDLDESTDPNGYFYRNCTSYVAWRIGELTGTVPMGMGNGGSWDNNRPSTSDNTPEPGDAAVWDTTGPGDIYGHVAYVESVNSDGSVNISDYNFSSRGGPGTRNKVRAHHYVDFNGPGVGKPDSGPPPVPHGPTTLGTYNPNTGAFYLRNSNTSGGADVSLQYGNHNWMPLAGDWDGNGTVTPGVYDPNTSKFYLRNSNTSGPADTSFQYGNIGWKPIAGDWDGNGYWSVGLQDPNTSTFYLKNYNGPGGADYTFGFGNGGWLPIAGDWDGRDDGNPATSIGVYNPNTATFYLNNENDGSAAEKTIQYGNIGWTAIAGDWDGNGFWSIGSYNPKSATFYLRNTNNSGPADITAQYGNIGWKPVVGDWDSR